jgi:hypothetical protein
MIGVLLFAQGMVAAAACDWQQSSPAIALAQQSAAPTCHEADTNLNVCLAHCLADDQRADVPQLGMLDLPHTPVLVLRQPVHENRAALFSQLPAPSAHPPPPRILFQTLLI